MYSYCNLRKIIVKYNFINFIRNCDGIFVDIMVMCIYICFIYLYYIFLFLIVIFIVCDKVMFILI